MPLIFQGHRGQLLKTGQQTIVHMGDDGDRQAGLTRPTYIVYSAGSPYSDTPNVDVPHYAGTDIAFVNGGAGADTITSATVDFTTIFKAADVIICVGSPNAANLLVRTIAVAGVAVHTITLTSVGELTNEAAGNYITMFKRVTPSGNVVYDTATKLYWLRYSTNNPALKIGTASTGLLCWYDASKCYTLHASGADLAMDASAKTLTIVGGTAESTKFKIGTFLEFAGFTLPNNNLAGGYRITSLTPGVSDLVIGLDTGYGVDGSQTGTTHNGTKIIDGLTNTSGLRIGMAVSGAHVGAANYIKTIDSATQVTVNVNSTGNATESITFSTLGTEAAGGSRSIKIVTQDIFSWAAACNAASLGGFTDWRVSNVVELFSLLDQENGFFNTTAFPSVTSTSYWVSSKRIASTTNARVIHSYYATVVHDYAKTSAYPVWLVRG